MVTAEQIKQWIEQGLQDCQAIVDGDGRHFNAVVVCRDFFGKKTMQRHRMVYAALGERMHADIHALSLKTLTPDENNKV